MRNALFLSFVLACISLHGQSIEELEAEMAEVHNLVAEGATDMERLEASNKLRDLLITCFDEPSAFEYPFEKVYRMATLESPDGAFRLFNWNVPMLDETHKYFAFVLFPKGKYVELIDTEILGHDDENKVYTPESWYGAVYYDIFPVKVKKETYYTLLGWDGNDRLSNKKMLDVMRIDKKNKISFGKPIFQLPEDVWVNRRLFEYSKEVSMSLRYLEPKDAIVFDFLEAPRGGLEGQYAFYGPGLQHDAYRLNKEGQWILIENIDMSRPKDSQEGPQFNFPDKVDPSKVRSKVNPLTGK